MKKRPKQEGSPTRAGPEAKDKPLVKRLKTDAPPAGPADARASESPKTGAKGSGKQRKSSVSLDNPAISETGFHPMRDHIKKVTSGTPNPAGRKLSRDRTASPVSVASSDYPFYDAHTGQSTVEQEVAVLSPNSHVGSQDESGWTSNRTQECVLYRLHLRNGDLYKITYGENKEEKEVLKQWEHDRDELKKLDRRECSRPLTLYLQCSEIR